MKANAKRPRMFKELLSILQHHTQDRFRDRDHLYGRNSFRSYNSCDRMGFQHCLPWSLFKWWHHVHRCNRNTVINVLQYKQQSTWKRPPSCCREGYFVNKVHLAGKGKGTLIWELQSSEPSLKSAQQFHFVNTPPVSPALITFWLSHFIQVRIVRSAIAPAFLSYLSYLYPVVTVNQSQFTSSATGFLCFKNTVDLNSTISIQTQLWVNVQQGLVEFH